LPAALFRRRPALRGLPFVSLGQFPTALERVEGLVSPRVELWVKREDRAGLAYGGNKVRKLEFLLGEAIARGKKRVVTIGGWGSHHALATAIYARQLGLACGLYLFPQPVTDHVRAQLAADRAAGASVHEVHGLLSLALPLLSAQLAGDTFYVAAGGSSVIGTLGWVSAADEIIEQCEAGLMPRPSSIYVALGSCGTAAGLLAGLRGSSLAASELVAVRVVERPVSGFGTTRKLEERTLERMGDAGRAPPIALRVVHDQLGRGYGHATPAALAAVEAAARVGLHLEPTYTGKALAALIAEADSGALDGKRVLFIDTYSSSGPAPTA